MFLDKGKSESCLVKAPAMHASESVLMVGELLCTGVQAVKCKSVCGTLEPTRMRWECGQVRVTRVRKGSKTVSNLCTDQHSPSA